MEQEELPVLEWRANCRSSSGYRFGVMVSARTYDEAYKIALLEVAAANKKRTANVRLNLVDVVRA